MPTGGLCQPFEALGIGLNSSQAAPGLGYFAVG
jgi:hypothetical protein